MSLDSPIPKIATAGTAYAHLQAFIAHCYHPCASIAYLPIRAWPWVPRALKRRCEKCKNPSVSSLAFGGVVRSLLRGELCVGLDVERASDRGLQVIFQKAVCELKVCFTAVHPLGVLLDSRGQYGEGADLPGTFIIKEPICPLFVLFCDSFRLLMPLEPGLVLFVEAPGLTF